MDAGEGEPDAQSPATSNNSMPGRISDQLPSTIVPFTAIHDGTIVRAKNSTSFPVYATSDRTLAATNLADALLSSSKRRLFGQSLPPSIQANSSATPNMSAGSSGSDTPATPRKSPSARLAGSTATAMDIASSKKRSPTTKKTPCAKSPQAPSRDKPATESPPTSSSKKRKRTGRLPAPETISPPKKKIRVETPVLVPKHPRANTSPAKVHKWTWGGIFNPYGIKQAKVLLPEFSSLGHSTLKTSPVSVLQKAFGRPARYRRTSSPLFMEKKKPMFVKKGGNAKADGGAATNNSASNKSASNTNARVTSAHTEVKTTNKTRDTTYPAAKGSPGSFTNKAIRKEAGGSKNMEMEKIARSKASAATQDSTANGHKKRPSVSTKSGSASTPPVSARDDNSQTGASTPRKRAAMAPMTSTATIKAYYATPAKRPATPASSTTTDSRPRSRSASSTAKTTNDDGQEELTKKKLKKMIDSRTTKTKRKADRGPKFMNTDSTTDSDEKSPQSKRISKSGVGGGYKASNATSTKAVVNDDGGKGGEKLREALFPPSPPYEG